MTRDAHLVITDSGLGGLAICAAIERHVRERRGQRALRITYVNAWPDDQHGYNDLDGITAQAAVFDRALSAIDARSPDDILIACNTLSIVYTNTAHHGRRAVPVQGIVECGVDLFDEALRRQPSAALVLIGTRTTIDSAVHRMALLALDHDPARIAGASCHGLATAIEADIGGPRTAELIDACATRVADVAPGKGLLYVGLCCTHYGLVAPRIAAAVSARTGRVVQTLDPNERLVAQFVAHWAAGDDPARLSPVTVSVVSKVTLPPAKCDNIARALDAISPVTAAALRNHVHDPGLF